MDKYNLGRFLAAQERDYTQALREIKNGHKYSHWIWYIFPQIAGLGYSSTSRYYAISCVDEAVAYMQNPVLREHLLEISNALLELECCNPSQVMGYPDDLKLHSSMTLFALTAPEYDVFSKVLDKYFGGRYDEATLARI